MQTLLSQLRYEPVILKFGTSGRRGKVLDLTQLEVYINATAELQYLLSLPPEEGGIRPGDDFYIAYDLRPSTTAIVPEQGERGELAQAIVAAIRDAGLKPVNMGAIPTPALASYALAAGRGCIMITGSHIPFDLNGYKTNTSAGELLKKSEGPINDLVAEVRQGIYSRPLNESIFDTSGMLKDRQPLPAEQSHARDAYIERYTRFFGDTALAGMRLLVYQHSAVGRDLLPEILRRLGAEVVTAGRSDSFVPIDTENIDAAQLEVIQSLVDEAGGKFDAVVSTDGDSDRPLVLAVTESGQVRFYGGDLVGMVVAEYLNPDAIVVPISSNDAIDRGPLASVLEPKTRIGSPYVIAGMEEARAKGKRRICGWEANGGFLTGSDFDRNGAILPALPTRDAVLPVAAVLSAAKESGLKLTELFDRLPQRFSKSALLRPFPRPVGLAIVEKLPTMLDQLPSFFPADEGFGSVACVDCTDGVRITFAGGDVAHVRPSGNADEMRIYAVADTQERADQIAALGVAEPDGILRRMERSCASQ